MTTGRINQVTTLEATDGLVALGRRGSLPSWTESIHPPRVTGSRAEDARSKTSFKAPGRTSARRRRKRRRAARTPTMKGAASDGNGTGHHHPRRTPKSIQRPLAKGHRPTGFPTVRAGLTAASFVPSMGDHPPWVGAHRTHAMNGTDDGTDSFGPKPSRQADAGGVQGMCHVDNRGSDKAMPSTSTMPVNQTGGRLTSPYIYTDTCFVRISGFPPNCQKSQRTTIWRGTHTLHRLFQTDTCIVFDSGVSSRPSRLLKSDRARGSRPGLEEWVNRRTVTEPERKECVNRGTPEEYVNRRTAVNRPTAHLHPCLSMYELQFSCMFKI